MKELIVFAGEILFMAVVIGMYDKSEKFQQKIKSIKLFIEKHECIFFISMIAITIMMSVGFINQGHDWGGDFSQYLAQTRAILNGTVEEQVAAGTYIAEKSVVGLCPDVYPWGYCLLLLPVYALFGLNFFALKLVGVFYFALFVGLIYLFFRKRFGVGTSLMVGLLFAFNESYLTVIDSVISDMPFLFFSVLGMYAFYEILKEEKHQFIWAVICGTTSFFAYFCRANGIVSILTIVSLDILLIVSRFLPVLNRWMKKCGFVKQNVWMHMLIYILFFGGKILSDCLLPKAGEGYGALISQLSLESVIYNAYMYLSEGVFGIFRFGKYMAVIAEAAFLLMLIVGLIKSFWEELPLHIYTLGMTALLMIYPGFQGMRYLFTVIPFWVVIAIKGIQFTLNFLIDHFAVLKGKQVFSTAKLISGCLCIFFLVFSVRMILLYHVTHSYTTNQAYTQEALELYHYIDENTKDTDIIVSCKPRVIWLNTGRLGFSVQDGENKYLESDYILFLDGDGLWETEKSIQESEGEDSLVFEGEKCRLYRIE